MNVAELPENFELLGANVDSATAAVAGARRVILYNQYAIRSGEDNSRQRWAHLGVLSHQIGHHLFRHALDATAETRRRSELEADKFMGTVLGILGATKPDVETLLAKAPAAASVYPAADARRKSATDGWVAAEGFRHLGFHIEEDLPRFEMPPPHASAVAELPRMRRPLPDLGSVATAVSDAAAAAGYTAIHYWAVRDGFAAATAIEQINDDGTPKQGNRWSPGVAAPRLFSLRSYLRALFTAPRGRYRLIVFVVSPHAFSQRETTLRFRPSIDWLWSGLSGLPPSIASAPLTGAHVCTALVYEFEQADPYTEPVLKSPSALDGRTHLQMAGLWQALGR
jgi:hypothetical protein